MRRSLGVAAALLRFSPPLVHSFRPSLSFSRTSTATRMMAHSSDPTERPSYAVCLSCQGDGRISKLPSKKSRMRYKRARMEGKEDASPPVARWETCANCKGTGIVLGEPPMSLDMHVAIVGGGIGGLALGVALKHRGISFTIYERDTHFAQRQQGYGLTMQQASKALKSFGIFDLSEGVTSTKHVVHTPDGTVVGEWGLRKWGRSNRESKRQNIHIARQTLRRELLDALDGDSQVQWGCQLQDYTEHDNHVKVTLQRGTETFTTKADLLVGADGIRSTVRSILIGDKVTPLRYLDCLVVLGICPRADIPSSSPLLDETVFQTANGTTRLYAMPYSPTKCMWQLSFPLEEEQARNVSRRGAQALKDEALRLCGKWHEPVPELLKATPEALVSGYPVYDRELLTSDLLTSPRVTLCGDSAHPMSPFKGQGANQALLDALSLARTLYKTKNIKETLDVYHEEMLARTAVKVQASAEAARFLHTNVAIEKGNVTRGGAAKKVQSKSQS